MGLKEFLENKEDFLKEDYLSEVTKDVPKESFPFDLKICKSSYIEDYIQYSAIERHGKEEDLFLLNRKEQILILEKNVKINKTLITKNLSGYKVFCIEALIKEIKEMLSIFIYEMSCSDFAEQFYKHKGAKLKLDRTIKQGCVYGLNSNSFAMLGYLKNIYPDVNISDLLKERLEQMNKMESEGLSDELKMINKIEESSFFANFNKSKDFIFIAYYILNKPTWTDLRDLVKSNKFDITDITRGGFYRLDDVFEGLVAFHNYDFATKNLNESSLECHIAEYILDAVSKCGKTLMVNEVNVKNEIGLSDETGQLTVSKYSFSEINTIKYRKKLLYAK